MKRFLLALAVPAALVLAGCSGGQEEVEPKPSATSTFNVLDGLALPTETSAPKPTAKVTTTPKSTSTEPASRGIYGVTPDGLTTSVNAPILMSAEEMKQGCLDLQSWATSIAITDANAILALVQLTEEDSTEDFTVTEGKDGRWADQPPSDQAALIAMVNAATSGTC